MEEAHQQVQLQVIVNQGKEVNSLDSTASSSTDQSSPALPNATKTKKWWVRVSIYVLFLLVGQSVALMLGRLYFVKGGNSKWMATAVQLAGYPLLIPFYFFYKKPETTSIEVISKPPSRLTLMTIYFVIGVLAAGDCFLYSIGLQYLPVSTYTLICASQLAFNSLFSFFLNSQKFTPYIINALVLLTISSVLLVFNSESSGPTEVSKVKYAIGFVCTIAGSAGYGLVLSLIQLAFDKVIKRETFNVVMDMIIGQQVVATFIVIIGLFASGEWKGLNTEMNAYQLGPVSYIMNLFWTAVAWQVFSIGCVGVLFEVSSLFSNAISVLGLPVVPVLAVFFFNDKMDGVKVISMVLAVWGFTSYVYQHYVDHLKLRSGIRSAGQDSGTKHASKIQP